MINKNNLLVTQFVSTDVSRFTLNGILCTPQCTVATDGHRLVKITTPDFSVDSYPERPDFKAQADWKPFVMPTETAKDIAKALPKKTTIPILMNAAIGVRVEDRVPVMVTDLENTRVFDVRPVSGNFPDYERVMPNSKPVMEIGLNAKYMQELFGMVVKFADERQHACVLRLRGAGSPVEVWAKSDSGDQELTAIVMPHRHDSIAKLPEAAPEIVINTLELSYSIVADLFEGVEDPAQKERLLMDPALAGIVQRRIDEAIRPKSETDPADPETKEAESEPAEVVQ